MTLDHSPSQIIRQRLIDAGLGTDSGSWPVKFGGWIPEPDDMITTVDTERVGRGRFMVDGVVQEGFGVQILVRGRDRQTTWDKTKDVVDNLDTQSHLTTVAVTDTQEYGTGSQSYQIYNAQRRSGPLPLQIPDSGRFAFSINYVFTLRQLS